MLKPGGTSAGKAAPGDVLATLHEFVSPVLGEYFFAVGIKFNSFRLVHGFALLVVSVGPKVAIDLIGTATYASPPDLPAGIPALAYVELDVHAHISPKDGTIAIEGNLNPSSYVYSPLCHLPGQFAFYAWSTGEFVLSLGGYHPDYHPPPGYPVVQRVELKYQVTPEVYLKGDGLPWERSAASDASELKDAPPWLALLVLEETEIKSTAIVTARELTTAYPTKIGATLPPFSPLPTQIGDAPEQPVVVIEIEAVRASEILPRFDELSLLAGVREVNDRDGRAVVIANRLPKPGARNLVHLVSVESQYRPITPPPATGPTHQHWAQNLTTGTVRLGSGVRAAAGDRPVGAEPHVAADDDPDGQGDAAGGARTFRPGDAAVALRAAGAAQFPLAFGHGR